ncbi:GLPGLI family protein [Chryseobacterium salviniae]|uniref:GLPGLI family protein n=1 Tax=Chryseobacterium salviniae TaxID=3101750 RepID=A0ABU6HT07_9FLAO|nr:GLPGLI family protein [Chryseobacterium sp. T9W2-O]MEC3875017.1 GLPGLI family protein [Chryseobacterium sp. T9W2-O]
MNKKILFLVFNLLIFSIKAQKSFSSEYEAGYTLDYKKSNLPNAKSELTTFILMMNKKESYFKSMNVYVADSLKYYKKIKETGNAVLDFKTFSRFSAEYPENIGITIGKIYVTTPITQAYVSYEEPNNIEWTLINEFKKIGNANCQKAITKKYGRNWIAYFNPNIPLSFGPYKFNKLPGLIVELYDDKKDFHYKLYLFKKRKYVCPFANSYKNIKPAKKEHVYQWKKEAFLNTDFSDVLDNADAETIRKLNRNSRKLYDQYNPIELNPN